RQAHTRAGKRDRAHAHPGQPPARRERAAGLAGVAAHARSDAGGLSELVLGIGRSANCSQVGSGVPGRSRMIAVPVLIVAGGPVGLSASVLLSRLGVGSRLVERHAGTALHPKARNINMHTMEIFRQCGVENAVRAAGLPIERTRFLIWVESLAGR